MVGEPRKSDDREWTRDQKRRSNSSANVDQGPIGDRTRTEDPGLVTSRRFLSRLGDRYAGTGARTVTAAAAGQGAVSAARARETIGQVSPAGSFAPWEGYPADE
jgi:hypothetical protein